MVSSLDSRRFASALTSLQAEIRAARHDVTLLDTLAVRLSRLAAEISAAYEHAFLLAIEVAA